MVFNLPDRYMLLLNGLLVGVVAIFLALNVSDVVKLRLAANAVPSGPETSVATAPSPQRVIGLRPRALYEAITQRDIFNLTPAPESAPVENEDLQLKLLGTSQLSSGKPFAIIENQNGEQSLYRLGDTIPGVGQLLQVEPSRVVVLHNGRRVALAIPRDQEPAADEPSGRRSRRRPYSGPPMVPRPGMLRRPLAGVHQLGPNRYVLDRSTVNSNLQNLAPLFTQIRAIPNLHNGNSDGFRLSEIQPGSIFQQIGLRDGDVLTSVSGQTVTDPMKAMALLQTLRDRSAITLNVMRNGAPVQLYYNIR